MSEHEFDATVCDSTLRYSVVRVVHATVHQELQRELEASREYARGLKAALEEMVSAAAASFGVDGERFGYEETALENARAALAKNPEQITHASGDSRHHSGLAVGPVGGEDSREGVKAPHLQSLIEEGISFAHHANLSGETYHRRDAWTDEIRAELRRLAVNTAHGDSNG